MTLVIKLLQITEYQQMTHVVSHVSRLCHLALVSFVWSNIWRLKCGIDPNCNQCNDTHNKYNSITLIFLNIYIFIQLIHYIHPSTVIPK